MRLAGQKWACIPLKQVGRLAQKFSRHAIASRRHQVRGMKPEGKFRAGFFKDGASAGIYMASLLAGVCPAALNLGELGLNATGWAVFRFAVFPFEDRHQAGVIGWVLGLKLLEGVFFGLGQIQRLTISFQ